MALHDKATWKKTLLPMAAVLAAVAGVLIFFAISNQWWSGERSEIPPHPGEQQPSHELVRDAQGRPVTPHTIRLSPTAVKGLKVTTEPVRAAGDLLLPRQIGTLGYDIDRLYSVRPRFQGEVIELKTVKESRRLDGSEERVETTRLLGPGDWVHKGQVLAVIWSKELGDRKVALITAKLDLYLDKQLLELQEQVAGSGSLPEATFQATRTRVQKDIAAVEQAEQSLGVARLTPQEIEAISAEAHVIQKRLQGKPETKEQRLERLAADVQRWARVDVVAPRSGYIVEKNTNVNDMVDPSKDTPMFRIADLDTLQINVNFNEEYLALLQPLMRRQQSWSFLDNVRRFLGLAPLPLELGGDLRWKIQIQADADVPELDLPILRIAPSLDPNNHTAMVIGRIPNPVKDRNGQDKRLVVGQFVTATIVVPPEDGVVDIPTNALNEVNGESLVLVQPDPDRNEYVLRRVAVVRRARDVTQVRSRLTPRDRELSAEEVRHGRRPIEPVRVGERLVTRGITEITDAFDALLALVRVEKR
jgi:cobalt-zinc-cadmium efflux system membrane fusion protein